MDEEPLISRDELTAMLFTINDIAVELQTIRELLEDADGEEPEA